jgi:AraC-like DNA-binding protein
LIECFLPRSLYHSDLYLVHCGMQDCQPGHYYGPAVRDHYLLHYIRNGKGIFRSASVTYELHAGQGFLIHPDEVTYYEADLAEPWSYCWAGFNGLLAETLLRKAGLSQARPIFQVEPERGLDACILEMIDLHGRGKARDIRLTGKVYELMAILVESGPGDQRDDGRSQRESYTEEVIRFIETNYASKISVSDIARSIGLNRSYLNSLFKRQMNTSIQTYLMRFRIERACELMTNRLLTIGDIARSVGYDDPLLFSKVFRKLKGMSPREYRRLTEESVL